MKRNDDYLERRAHLAGLTDKELEERFWELANKLVDPLLQMGYEYTSPAVERSVLLRMGISSLDTQKIVNGCMDHGLMGKGAGHCVYKLSKIENISIPEAGTKLANGEGWDVVSAAFRGGK